MDQLALEAKIRAACSAGDYQAATVVVLECYGAELYSLLLSRFQGRPSQAEDAFSEFSEDLRRSLPRFEWRCSVRSWCYKLARSAAARVARVPHNRAGRRRPLSEFPGLEQAVAHARTSTAPYLRTEIKEGFDKLRESLSQEDRDLLTLRIDRDLPWREVAYIMASGDDGCGEELARFEAALRQRFTELKKRLRKLATEAGLL